MTWKNRGSHRTCSLKKGFLKNFTISQENTCARVSFLIKFPARVFSCKICEIFKNTFFIEHFRTTASRKIEASKSFAENNLDIFSK